MMGAEFNHFGFVVKMSDRQHQSRHERVPDHRFAGVITSAPVESNLHFRRGSMADLAFGYGRVRRKFLRHLVGIELESLLPIGKKGLEPGKALPPHQYLVGN